MSIDESTQAERDFFASRGRNTDALVAENPDLKADRITDEIPAHEARDTGAGTKVVDDDLEQRRGPVQVPERQPSPTVTGAYPETSEARSGPISDDQDEPGPPGSPHPKRVGWTRYKQLLDEREALAAERKAWLAERQEWTDRFARADERLKLINDAMTPADQDDPDPRPDPTQDAYAHMEWQNRQRERDRQEFQQYLQQQAQRDVETQIVEAYRADATRFASQVPQFGAAYHFAINSRDVQLQSLEPWRSPQERAQIIKDEEFSQVRGALEHGQSPAQAIYQLARLWGFDGWYADQLSKQQQTAGAQASFDPAVNGAAGNSHGTVVPGMPAPAPAAPQNSPSAVQQVQNVIAGQAASRSLSQAGGGNPVQNFSARELADMSEDEFNAVFSRLQGTGNKARLRELMGA